MCFSGAVSLILQQLRCFTKVNKCFLSVFVHSKTYVAPFHGRRSQLQSGQKGRVSNDLRVSIGDSHSSCRRPFQTLGPTTENAWFCLAGIRVWANGSARTPFSAQRRAQIYPGPPTLAETEIY